MPIQARRGRTTLLRLGDGPQFVAIEPVEAGGDPGGTREEYFGDPHGIVVQVVDRGYCEGSAPWGTICPTRNRKTKALWWVGTTEGQVQTRQFAAARQCCMVEAGGRRFSNARMGRLDVWMGGDG